MENRVRATKARAGGKRRGRPERSPDPRPGSRFCRYDMPAKFGYYSGPEVIAEFDGSNNLDTLFTMGPGIDNLISVTTLNKNGKNARTSYAVSDALGSIRSIVGDNGQELNRYEYTPFGVACKAVEGVKQPYRFTGRRWDPNTNLYWYRSRSYDPGRGRFTQADKWFASVSKPYLFHSFTYVVNNPLIFNDPFGLTENIIFDLGISNEDRVIYENSLPGFVTVSVNSKEEIFNYLISQNKNGTSLTQIRSDDKVGKIVFLGHGDTEKAYANGIELFAKDWQDFGNENSDKYSKVFEQNLEVEFRLCDLGSGSYIDKVAKSLPRSTSVKGYTTFVTTTNEGDWGVLSPFTSSRTVTNKTIIDTFFSRTVVNENCKGPDPSTPSMLK